jgi:hypothetical protein
MANYEGIIRVLSSVLHLLLPKWSTIALHKEEDIKEEEKEEKEEKEEEEEEEEDTDEVTAMKRLKKQQTLPLMMVRKTHHKEFKSRSDSNELMD